MPAARHDAACVLRLATIVELPAAAMTALRVLPATRRLTASATMPAISAVTALRGLPAARRLTATAMPATAAIAALRVLPAARRWTATTAMPATIAIAALRVLPAARRWTAPTAMPATTAMVVPIMVMPATAIHADDGWAAYISGRGAIIPAGRHVIARGIATAISIAVTARFSDTAGQHRCKQQRSKSAFHDHNIMRRAVA
ncbi:MAG TPA: hypothetical protein VMH92_06595 [Acidocella sp.]|nr:hypothetical protein [Acidocella sp.]